ncbi:hypothetical protein HDR59_05390 [bacterium]|nr:hypothetical protein [bacterium]
MKIQNFIEDNISRANKLTISDVKKALPFMSDDDAQQMLNGMKNMLENRAG